MLLRFLVFASLGLISGFLPNFIPIARSRCSGTVKGGFTTSLRSEVGSYLSTLSPFEVEGESKEGMGGNDGSDGSSLENSRSKGGGVNFSEGDFSVESTKSAVEFGELGVGGVGGGRGEV